MGKKARNLIKCITTLPPYIFTHKGTLNYCLSFQMGYSEQRFNRWANCFSYLCWLKLYEKSTCILGLLCLPKCFSQDLKFSPTDKSSWCQTLTTECVVHAQPYLKIFCLCDFSSWRRGTVVLGCCRKHTTPLTPIYADRSIIIKKIPDRWSVPSVWNIQSSPAA